MKILTVKILTVKIRLEAPLAKTQWALHLMKMP